jgi:glycosyltransferase involved in cell wall biosynthesis
MAKRGLLTRANGRWQLQVPLEQIDFEVLEKIAEEIVGAYHAATALWFPSNARSEGFGLVQVEAMASGCPVISSNDAFGRIARDSGFPHCAIERTPPPMLDGSDHVM